MQQGCDHRCTFCIIPFARGPNRSVPEPLVTARVRQLVANGYREIVLTGVDICSWGADLPGRPTLGGLVQAILASVPELPRLRLSTLDPAAIDERLFRVLAEEPRLMPHLHLSLQAMDDLVLKRMKRRHSRADALAIAARARAARPDVVFGADLIAGFPTESEAMFLNTLNAVEEMGLTYLHVFPYSPRPDTPAARMPQVPRPGAPGAGGPAARGGRSRARPVLRRPRRHDHRGAGGKGGIGRCPWYAPVSLGASSLSERNRARCCRFASMPPMRSGCTRRLRRDRGYSNAKAGREARLVPTIVEPRRSGGGSENAIQTARIRAGHARAALAGAGRAGSRDSAGAAAGFTGRAADPGARA